MMTELPLFPLYSVLFPGAPIFLHIFEERYKQMIRSCITQRQPFGVVLIKRGQEVNGPAEPYPIACTAEIVQLQSLHDQSGRFNIVAMGRERIRIHGYHNRLPYLMGQVETYPLPPGGPAGVLKQHYGTLLPWVERYMGLLGKLQKVRFDASQLPQDPVEGAYLAAHLLQAPAPLKQELLAAASGLALLQALQGHYRREIALLRAMLTRLETGMEGGEETTFSLN